MQNSDTLRPRTLFAYLLLVAFGCAPIWSVEYFIQQDGSAHVYNAYLMGQIIHGNASMHSVALNTIAVPNSTGHWLLAGLLQFFDTFTATRMIASLTFALTTAAGGYMYRKTAGAAGTELGFLIGAVFSFNWLWFAGFYNFTIGVACFVFTAALYFGWRGRLSAARVALLSICLLICYWSHIVSFGMLAGTVFMLALFGESADRRSTVMRTALSALPVLPMFFMFRSTLVNGDPMQPYWRSIKNSVSPYDWLIQITSADPFVLISRKALPFTDASSNALILIAPIVWIAIGLTLLLAASTFSNERAAWKRHHFVFLFVIAGCLVVGLFGPDDFGLTSGSILRERVLICGLFLTIPLLVRPHRPRLARAGTACLIFAFLFQTAAVWDYAIRTTRDAAEFMPVKVHIPDGASVASIVAVRHPPKFHSIPMPQLNTYNGVGRNIRIWDNYELGHRLFPVVTREEQERAFIHELTQISALYLYDGNDLDQRLDRLRKCLEENNARIDVLVTWDIDARTAKIVESWFESEPFFANGRLKAFYHRSSPFNPSMTRYPAEVSGLAESTER